ncbi:hypothetical protein P8452_68532 [Trifolium repens]|nr:hypothetical protein P8452_68532 [Trifolium repens]
MSNKSSEETSYTQTQKSSESRQPIRAISYVIFFVVFVLVFGLIISLPIVLTISHEPPPTKFSIVEASIAQFNLTNNNTLYYNFEHPFKLSSKNVVRLQPLVFEGSSVVILEPQQLVKYNKETQLGIYNIDLDLDLNNFGGDYIHCSSLRVPLIFNAKVAPTFNVTTCSHKDGF